MKVLFIIKPFFIEPLGLMYLSASAKQAGHETKLATTNEDLELTVNKFQPDVIGFSVMTGDENYFLGISRKLKKVKKFISVFGGPHPTFFPEIIKEEGIDIVCKGEGEEAFTELLNKLEKNEDIREILNLIVKDQNGIITTNNLRPLSDIDSLPFPDRDLVFDRSEIKDGPIKHFLASRGCPFSCSYCFNDKYFELYCLKRKTIRFRNPKSIVDEIESVVNSCPTKFIYFQDDTITLDKEWLKELCEIYGKRIKLPFHCHVRPNTLDKEKVQTLKKAGVYSVHIAAETANDRLRNEILKRGMSKESIVNGSKLLKEAGIKFMLQNMIGLPTGTIADDIATLELNIECQPDYAWVSIYQPYPGTALGEFAKEQGLYDGSQLNNNFFEGSPLKISEEYKRQLACLQKLFAIIVDNPVLHKIGLAQAMINTTDPKLIEAYKQAYSNFRKKADERLYGFKL